MNMRLNPAGWIGLNALALLIGGLSITRLLYEAVFPQLSFLGAPVIALAVAALFPAVYLADRIRTGADRVPPLWPIFINVIWLFDPAVDLIGSRFWMGLSLWLIWLPYLRQRWQWIVWGILPLILIYGATLGRTVGHADTFEFQVVAPQLGIAHPTGYPLFLMWGKLWSLLIPFGTVAMRLNIGVAIYAIAACVVLGLVTRFLFDHFATDLDAANGNRLAILTGLVFGLTPTYWSQAIEAEVYTLHLLFVSAILLGLLNYLLNRDHPKRDWLPFALSAGVGFGLTHHLTTVFMIPAIVASLFIVRGWRVFWPRFVVGNLVALLSPLLIYLYLPIRWRAVNEEPMGVTRFFEWVVGGRFQGALQWGAIWSDPARFDVIQRLFSAEWHRLILVLAAAGLAWLTIQNWRVGLVLALTWLGYTYYCLSYYVPDLSVFLLPSHLIIAVTAVSALFPVLRRIPTSTRATVMAALFLIAAWAIPGRYEGLDASGDDGRVAWGYGVLTEAGLETEGAILADSDKFPPLYYLQQAEGLRPDLHIAVLPDEGSYRSELDRRIAAGETVYLARFLPNLAGVYHLNSAGPLTHVTRDPLEENRSGDAIFENRGAPRLVDVETAIPSRYEAGAVDLVLKWTLPDSPSADPLRIYVRWAGGSPIVATGTHPANDDYPTVAWRPGEVVTDYHALPIPNRPPDRLDIEVAFAPPFTASAELDWRPVASVDFAGWSPPAPLSRGQDVRMSWGDVGLSQIDFPSRVRPGSDIDVRLAGPQSERVEIEQVEIAYGVVLRGGVSGEMGRCGWFRPLTEKCELAPVAIQGVPLPAGATNYGDQIALLNVEVPDPVLSPGGTLDVNVTWQALSSISDDFTVFVQVLDSQDQLVGQVDAFPLQGTFPTSAWRVGETVNDPYQVPISAEAAPGEYRLILGFYRLSDLQRLPVLNADGDVLNDKFEFPGLSVAP